MVEIFDVRHLCPEAAGIEIERPLGYPSYTFIHFINPVDILVNGKMLRTEPHSFIVYKIGTPQRYHSPTPLTNNYIHFGVGMEDALKEYGIDFDTIYYPSDPYVISSIILEMQQLFFSVSPLNAQLLNIKLHELFIKLARNVKQTSISRVDHNLQREFVYLRIQILSRLEFPWTVETMATMLRISKSRFHSLYKEIFGRSPSADLIHARIDRAKTMLTLTRKPIANISAELGYSNPAHFMRQFKSIVGVAPGAYRKEARLMGDSLSFAPIDDSIVSGTFNPTIYHQNARNDYPEYRHIITQAE